MTGLINNINLINRWVLTSLLIMTGIELIAHPDLPNIYGCFVFIISWLFLSSFVFKQENLDKCFIPYMIVFGVALSFFWLPLVITLIEGKPLTFRFQNPYLTFNNQLLNILMMSFAFLMCKNWYKSNNSLTRLWEKFGYFTTPSKSQIWILGFIGLGSRLFFVIIQGSDAAAAENLGVIGHLAEVTASFVAFPYLLLFPRFYGGGENKSTLKTPLLLYSLALIVVCLATGKRQILFLPFTSILMCYIIPVFTENRRTFTRKNVILLFLGTYLVFGPLTDITIAMALGRDDSDQTSGKNTYANILNIYNDKETLHTLYQAYLATQDNGGNNDYGWSEYYVDNLIFDRFCNLRVCDATLYYADRLGYDNPRMHEYLSNQILFLLPTPILNMFGVHVNKFELQFSPGDLISSESLNYGHQYHGYRVAGDTGIGLYLWGYKYYFIALFVYFALFYFYSSTIKINNNALLIPLPVMASLFATMWSFNNSSGIVRVISILLRTGWQAIVVYCIVFYIVRKISK